MRVRITFSKSGALKYIGHLDLNMVWERATRRAGLPLAYSQGFHPQPKMTFASALPLGFSSHCEVMDMRLNQDEDLASLFVQLQNALPAGIGIIKVESVDEHEPALQTQVLSAEYEVILKETPDVSSINQKIDEVMACQSLLRQRRGKSYDLRPLIEALSLTPLVPSVENGDPTPAHPPKIQRTWSEAQGGEGYLMVFMRLAAREGATGRPEEVLDALGIPIEHTRVKRTRLIFKNQAW